MLEVAGEEVKTLSMDHHGLVAAVCKDLKIAERIDGRLGVEPGRVVSAGQAVVAMILNGLGFTNRRLYLTHQFFETKPVSRLLDADIEAKDLTDYTLGHALDDIWSYGSSQLFGEVAFDVALDNGLLGHLNHIDTTSLSVEGEYDVPDKENVIHITHGYSKDKRPDLKQAVLSLVVNGPSNMPIWMEALDGNSSDKTNFHETIKRVNEFKKQINLDSAMKWIADSALYTQDKLLKNNDYLWVTRVPETIKETTILLEKSETEINWVDMEKGYKVSPFKSSYGEIEQRWLLVYSAQAYKREQKTLEKNLDKKADSLEKALWHLGNEVFGCPKDAESALKSVVKKYPLFKIESVLIEQMKYPKKGRPSISDEKISAGYKIETTFYRNAEVINKLLNKKGRFILATNDLDPNYTDQMILTEYKEQQHVEGGFRFIKDPWFMVDSIFLKSPKRIEALMMIMTLCLLIYNVAQYKLRQSLIIKDDTIPNQLGKEIKNPTVRWIFQIMEGIGIIRFFDESLCKPVKEMITNLNTLRKKIIYHFGENACRMYGLIQKNQTESLGM
jgi:transposase